jgi:hypothetical protein
MVSSRSSNAINSFRIMKRFSLVIFSAAVLALGACSEKKETTVKPPSTPDAERLKSDSERLQQATNNAAKEREKAAQRSSTPSPAPTATP